MTILYFILLIGVLIFVHEIGHFFFAKLFDVKVIKFSLGFGPKAAGFRRGETEYCVAWVPLGGYVKMLGEDPSDEIIPADQGRAFNQKPLWQRYIIVLAGPAFNLIFPIFIYFVFFATQTVLLPSVVGKVFPEMPAAEAGLQPGDRIVAIGGEDVRYWEDLQSLVSDQPGQSLRFTVEREGKRFDRFITPKEQISQNRLMLVERVGRIGVSPYFELAQIGISSPDSPAAKAGLKTGDLITSVNGKMIERWNQLEAVLKRNSGRSLQLTYLRPGDGLSDFFDLRLLSPGNTVLDPEARQVAGRVHYTTGLHSAEFYIREVKKDSPAAKMGMRPGDRVTHFNGAPLKYWETILLGLEAKKDATHTIAWVPYGGAETKRSFKLLHVNFKDEYSQQQTRYVFGAKNRLLRKTADMVPIKGRFTYAVSQGVQKTGEIVGVTVLAVIQLFRKKIPSNTIGGPLMLYYTAGVAAEKGWDHFLWMMALISINLGILNLLPIPVLDGGHILFFTIEAVKRRPPSLRARELASYVGLVLLLSLMIFALKNDIVRYWFSNDEVQEQKVSKP